MSKHGIPAKMKTIAPGESLILIEPRPPGPGLTALEASIRKAMARVPELQDSRFSTQRVTVIEGEGAAKALRHAVKVTRAE